MWVPATAGRDGSALRGAWPTPAANKITESGVLNNRDGTPWDGVSKPHSSTTGRMVTTALTDAVSNWPTPTARDWKGSNAEDGLTRPGGGSRMDQLANAAVYSHLAQATRDGLESLPETHTSRQHLNPLFAAWLMGWTSTWVIAEPHASSALETASFHCALRQQLSCLLGEQEFSKGFPTE
jgi:hypothetical protein